VAKESDPAKIQKDLSGGPCETVDIFLLQEVVSAAGDRSVADQVGKRLGYTVAFSTPAGVYNQGLAILSRFPLAESEVIPLKAFNLKFHTRKRFTLSAIAHTSAGDLRLWNVHLDTRINPAERLDQLEPVLRLAAETGGPALIGGDLNTTRFHWLANVIPYPWMESHAAAVRGAMAIIGFETPFADDTTTFPFLKQHLDWLFVRNIRTEDSGTFPTHYSDHQAIWATLQVQQPDSSPVSN